MRTVAEIMDAYGERYRAQWAAIYEAADRRAIEEIRTEPIERPQAA